MFQGNGDAPPYRLLFHRRLTFRRAESQIAPLAKSLSG
jgi:hypothetical protein